MTIGDNDIKTLLIGNLTVQLHASDAERADLFSQVGELKRLNRYLISTLSGVLSQLEDLEKHPSKGLKTELSTMMASLAPAIKATLQEAEKVNRSF